ncbi:MAG: hypothetical protein ACOCUV_00085 [bacterium]
MENNKFNIEKLNWSDWKKFPDPRKGEYLSAPFGFGVYQLKNTETDEFILFGKGNNCAYRMSSLLPIPLGTSGRNAEDKKEYIFENLQQIFYRTMAFDNEEEMLKVERRIKKLNIHKFNR